MPYAVIVDPDGVAHEPDEDQARFGMRKNTPWSAEHEGRLAGETKMVGKRLRSPSTGLWLNAGSGAANEDAAAKLPTTPDGCFLHWFFVHDWNSFIHVCARDASMERIEPEPVPARAGTRALFPEEEIATRHWATLWRLSRRCIWPAVTPRWEGS